MSNSKFVPYFLSDSYLLVLKDAPLKRIQYIDSVDHTSQCQYVNMSACQSRLVFLLWPPSPPEPLGAAHCNVVRHPVALPSVRTGFWTLQEAGMVG